MSHFEVPKEFDGFVSSAAEVLAQYQQLSSTTSSLSSSVFSLQDFVIFRIFLDPKEEESPLPEALEKMVNLRQQVHDVMQPLIKGYFFHKDQTVRVKVALPEDHSPLFLCGLLEHGDSVDDEWFVVSLLYEVSRKLPFVSITVTDMDGQFLLIEASDQIPEWLSPDNSENRVWIKNGQLHIIPLDEVGRKRGGGLEASTALGILARSCNQSDSSIISSTLASPSVQRVLQARVGPALARNHAQRHTVAVTVPIKVAKLLAVRPNLVSEGVHGLCSGTSKQTNKFKSSMSYFGVSPLVTVPVTLTRALYAQLTFHERFHPPPKLQNAQRMRLQQMEREANEKREEFLWDAASSKAFDIGSRLACGLEIRYQQALNNEKEWLRMRNRRAKKASNLLSAISDKDYTKQLVAVPSAQITPSTLLSPHESEESSTLDILSGLLSPLSFSEIVNISLKDTPTPLSSSNSLSKHGDSLFTLPCEDDAPGGENDHSIDDIVITEVSPNSSDDDAWLYMTPEEFDANMEARMNNISVAEVTSSSANSTGKLSKSDSPGGLDSIISGMDGFINAYSEFDGIGENQGADVGHDSSDDSDDNDDIVDNSDNKITAHDTMSGSICTKDRSAAEKIDRNVEANNEIEDIEFDPKKLHSLLSSHNSEPNQQNVDSFVELNFESLSIADTSAALKKEDSPVVVTTQQCASVEFDVEGVRSREESVASVDSDDEVDEVEKEEAEHANYSDDSTIDSDDEVEGVEGSNEEHFIDAYMVRNKCKAVFR